MFRNRQPADGTDASQPFLRCSFCNKAEKAVGKLIAGPTVFICDECVQVCNDIIANQPSPSEADDVEDQLANLLPPGVGSGPPIQCALCRTTILVSDGLPIRNRGVLCLGCIGEVEAAAAERRESGL